MWFLHKILSTEGRPQKLINLFFFLQFQDKVANPLFVFLKHCERRHIALEAFF